jgi:uncharacterized protein YjiS (DUF1127 family)
MEKVYFATVIAMAVTTSIAAHLLAVGALGTTTSGFLVSLRARAYGYFARIRHFFSDCIAAARADRERRVAVFELISLTDREMKDVGLYRGCISHDPGCLERQAGVRGQAAAPYAGNGRRS